jgi:hypothetical protein
MKIRIDFENEDSSMLKMMTFNINHSKNCGKLWVVFKNNTIYEYDNVELHDVVEVIQAESYGSAFNKWIKKYPYNSLHEDD